MRLRRPGTSGPDAPREPPDPSAGWLRRDLRAAPLAVWCVVLLNLLLLGVWTTLQPSYRGLDESAHVDMVVDLPSPFAWPAPGEKLYEDSTNATVSVAGADGPLGRRLIAADALPKDERPSYDEVGPSKLGPAVNQMVQHPPLYYAGAAAVLAAVPGSDDWPFDRTVWLLRALTALLVVPLPLLCWLAARRLGLSVPGGVAASLVPLANPGLSRVSASVTNDTLLTLTVSSTAVLALAIAGGDLRRRTALAAALVAVLGMYAKGLGLVLPVLVAAAYVVAVMRGSRWRAAFLPGAVAVGLAGVVGGTWYVRNLVVAGTVQPNGYPGGGLPYPVMQGGGFGEWAPDYVDLMAFRFWSALGQPEPPELDEDLCAWLSGIVVALAVLAVVVASRRRLLVGVALLPLAGLLMLVAYGSYSNFQTYDRLIGVQGRYLYPALAGLAAVMVLPLDRLLGPLRRLLPAALLVFAAYMQYIGGRAVLQTYWTPAEALGDVREGFTVLETWSPLPDLMVRGLWGGAVLAGVVTAAALVLMLLPQRPRSEAPAAEPAAEPTAEPAAT